MRRISSIALVGMLALGTVGCGVFGGGEEQSTTPSPTAQAPASAPVPSPSPAVSPTPGAPDPPEEEPAVVATAPELIQSTNAEQRVQELEKEGGRQEDPFNVLNLPPIVERPEEPTPQRTNPIDETRIRTLPGVPRTGGRGTPIRGNTISGGSILLGRGGATSGAAVEIAPLAVPDIPALEPPPTLGQLPIAIAPPAVYLGPPPAQPPNTARAVEITGVIEFSSGAKAIVKAPNEQSRYVGEGDRLANGAVLVKRIETNPSADPVVILEENGEEVFRTVGTDALPPLDPPPVPSVGANTDNRTIGGVRVSSLRLRGATLVGRVTNVSSAPVRVSRLTLRIEEKGTGTLVNTVTVGGPDGELAPDQAGFIQSAGVNTFGLNADELTVKFESWQ